jgi:uncharacterized protein Smg (DUF494 family)
VKGRIIDIIVYLMHKIDESGKGLSQFDSLVEDLHDRGYQEGEINTAFFWLLEKLRLRLSQLSRMQSQTVNKSSRILHSTERLHFSNAGYGYLIQLYQLGLIDDDQREQIIQRAILSGWDEIGEPEIKYLAARLLLDNDEDQLDPGHLLLLDENTDGAVH